MKLKRRELLLLGGVSAAAAAYALTRRPPARRGAPPAPEPEPEPKPVGKWADPEAPERIQLLASLIEDQTGWIGLGDFLVAVAWTESRGNPDACNQAGGGCLPNNARGWFQMRPKSALAPLKLEDQPWLLFNEPWAVAMAAWYAYRLRKYARDPFTMDWLAVRRGWALPSLVKDVDEDKERSRDTRRRFEDGVAHAGLPDSFMYERAFPAGFDWPGVNAILDAVGAPPPEAVA